MRCMDCKTLHMLCPRKSGIKGFMQFACTKGSTHYREKKTVTSSTTTVTSNNQTVESNVGDKKQ